MIILSEQFLKPYREGKIKPKWGPVGAVTYYRTYSRKQKSILSEDGTINEINQMEHWVDTVKRVVEGNFNLVPNDPTATIENAQKMFDMIYRMAILPPGRSLWMMGTKYQKERGSDALNNCWFIAVRPQSYENHEPYQQEPGYLYSDPYKPMPSMPFVFTFDRAMTGGGVGFSIQKKNIEQFPKITTKVNLKIYLDPNHKDWDYIKQNKDYQLISDILIDNLEETKDYDMYQVPDSRHGWGMAYRELIDGHWLDKQEVNLCFDMSLIRGYGEPIRGFGGTSSGPLPLMILFKDVNDILNKRLNDYLKDVDALDIMNLTGRCVVAGNVRRTALIAIGSPDSETYINAKNYLMVHPIMKKHNNFVAWGEDGKQIRLPFEEAKQNVLDEIIKNENINFDILNEEEKQALLQRAEEKTNELFFTAWAQENHRWASNNSIYTDENFTDWKKPVEAVILNGEPGFVNEYLMKNFGRIIDGLQENIDKDAEGMNPCAEITLANAEPCNLIEVLPYIIEKEGFDIYEALELATQYVYRITFGYYEWEPVKRIISKNRRIGVSLTGMQDYFLNKYGHYVVKEFKENENGFREPVFYEEIEQEVDSWYKHVKKVNQEHAKLLNSTPSIKLTTMKPSGTVSKLPGVSSGIHFHYSPYLLQRIRFHEFDENLKILKACGFPVEKAIREPNTVVVEFPVKAPNADHPNFKSSGDVSLEEQFANQYFFAKMWADNAVSATLTFKFEEENQIEQLMSYYGQKIKSISLLPYMGHGYVQAPWEPITKEEYERRITEIKMNPEDIYQTLHSLENIEILLEADCLGGACPIK
ncbi:MAG: ribonucleoside-triphosphate reductase, adenosylcobalamin-dependent [Ignavibacterium sp.]|nr:ribonucleoside-triphosphate reductase, adenosylcobalamin-dependent [Ignavibacterium sp.]